ncbi:MAG: hypothetical protein ABSH52_35035 [Terriglobia bacterium]|jgi:hypothetical protein
MHCSRCSEPFDCAKVYVWAEFHNDVNFGLATLCEACWKDVQMGLRALLTPRVRGERSHPHAPAFAAAAAPDRSAATLP